MRISQDSITFNGLEVSKSPIDLSAPAVMDPIWTAHVLDFSIQLIFDGTPAGEFKLQASSDKGTSTQGEGFYDLRNLGNWTDIECSNQLISEAGDHMWMGTNVGFRWVRVVWTPSGGSGNLTSAQFSTKGL